jgi:MFS family permease
MIESQKFLSFLHRSFIAPFKNSELLINYFGIFIGAFGFAGMMMFFAYDFAQYGAFIVTLFFTVRFFVANILCIPFIYFMFHRYKIKVGYIVIVTVQVIVAFYLYFFAQFLHGNVNWISTIEAALIFSLMSVPFWSSFHLNMLCFTSDQNRGNEVSVSQLVSFLGSMSGTLFSGFALAYLDMRYSMLGLFIILLLSTLIMAFISWKKDMSFLLNRPFNLIEAARTKKLQLLATMQEGVFQFLIGFFAPVWMWVLGIKSVTIGLLLSLQGIIKLCLSPIAGHLFHENKSRDIVLGASIKPLGWLPWIFIQAPWVMLISSSIWTVGMHLYSVGMGSRWYSNRCLASQSIREMALGVGRIICVLIAVPLLYNWGPQKFFILAFAMTSVTSVIALYLRKQEQSRRTIVPDEQERVI